MPDPPPKICIYPGCGRPAVSPHPLGGPQPSFCEREDHNALTAHQERRRRERGGQRLGDTSNQEEVSSDG
ncbi:MAG: hypothetical protein ABSG43_16770 [Solirubrobacteraceae bacterium]